MGVKVAVRVRPFNQREIKLNCNTTTLINLIDSKNCPKTKDFSYDHSFWSFDSFQQSENGKLCPNDDRYADQSKVYQEVGKEILENAWDGYHCCLFAYGQTGSGKSYSMIGIEPNEGIVPLTCYEIFQRINQNSDQQVKFEVSFSMLEIYNEKVQDLMIDPNQRPKGGLKIREHNKLGVYVDDLIKIPVKNYEQIKGRMDLGNQHRTIASTLMNECSSRAHTIITIEFKQIKEIKGVMTEKLSVINLVDLAGSEKTSKTNATGDRMQEANKINLSLTVLGQCIKALADIEKKKEKAIQGLHVPFRDSSLTRILSNALGGTSKTLMICALSPATDNFEETLSTLRYADRAKRIKCHAIVNESESDKKIRLLNEENTNLKQQIQQLMEQIINKQVQEESTGKLLELQEQLQFNSQLQSEFSKSYSQKVNESPNFQQSQILIDERLPYIINLNEDSQLNGKIKYQLIEGETHVGRKDGNPIPQIIMGNTIQKNHAVFKNIENKIFIRPFEKENGKQLFINGQNCFEELELKHNDRITIGTNKVFLLKIPILSKQNKEKYIDDEVIDWDFAMKENSKALEIEQIQNENYFNLQDKHKLNSACEERIRLQQQIEEEQIKNEQLLKQLQQMKNNKNENQLLKQQAQQQQQKLNEYEQAKLKNEEVINKIEQEFENQMLDPHQQILNRMLEEIVPQVLEANLIAKELQRNINFQTKLWYPFEYSQDKNNYSLLNKIKIKIQVINSEEGELYIWGTKKFQSRLELMKDELNNYFETQFYENLNPQTDPFWDPPEWHVIGSGFLKLMSLAYLMDNPASITLYGENGPIGQLDVNVIPTDETGTKNIGQDINENDQQKDEDDNIIEDPNELLGKTIYFKVIINFLQLTQSSAQLKDYFVKFQLQNQNSDCQKYSTGVCQHDENQIIDFKYELKSSIQNVQKEFIDYCLQQTIKFDLFAKHIVEKKIQQKKAQTINQLNDKVESEISQNIQKAQSLTQNNKQLMPKKEIKDDKQISQKNNPATKINKKSKDNCSIF